MRQIRTGQHAAHQAVHDSSPAGHDRVPQMSQQTDDVPHHTGASVCVYV